MMTIRKLCAALAAAFAATFLPAQEDATTLAGLCGDAGLVVLVDVLARIDPTPDTHAMRFAPRLVLKGQDPGLFEVREPAGACCGRTLFGLLPGSRHLLFLRAHDGAFHLQGGARGLAGGDAATVGHVQALLAADGAARTALLASTLEHGDARLRRDAALSLWRLPELASAPPAVRQAVERAALVALDGPADSVLPYLTAAAARSGSTAVLEGLIDAYVTGERSELRQLLRTGLPAFGEEQAAAALAARLPRDDDGRMRGIALLADLDCRPARAALVQVLRARPGPRVQLTAARVLLAQGEQPANLLPLVPQAVLEAAALPPPPPPLRVIRPESGR